MLGGSFFFIHGSKTLRRVVARGGAPPGPRPGLCGEGGSVIIERITQIKITLKNVLGKSKRPPV